MKQNDPRTRTGGPGAPSQTIRLVKVISAVIAVIALLIAAWYFAVVRPSNAVLDEDVPIEDTIINAGIDEQATDQDRQQAQVLKAQLLLQQGQYQQALDEIANISNIDSNYSALAIRAESQLGLGQDASATYAQMLVIYPNQYVEEDRTFVYWYELAQLAEKANDSSAAKSHYQMVLDTAPTELPVDDEQGSIILQEAEAKVAEL